MNLYFILFIRKDLHSHCSTMLYVNLPPLRGFAEIKQQHANHKVQQKLPQFGAFMHTHTHRIVLGNDTPQRSLNQVNLCPSTTTAQIRPRHINNEHNHHTRLLVVVSSVPQCVHDRGERHLTTC